MSTPEKRSHTDPDTVYPRKDYHAPKPKQRAPRTIDALIGEQLDEKIGELLARPLNRRRTIDELATLDASQHANFRLTFEEEWHAIEALREAREALEYYRDDQGAGRRRARELLAKWRGAG